MHIHSLISPRKRLRLAGHRIACFIVFLVLLLGLAGCGLIPGKAQTSEKTAEVALETTAESTGQDAPTDSPDLEATRLPVQKSFNWIQLVFSVIAVAALAIAIIVFWLVRVTQDDLERSYGKLQSSLRIVDSDSKDSSKSLRYQINTLEQRLAALTDAVGRIERENSQRVSSQPAAPAKLEIKFEPNVQPVSYPVYNNDEKPLMVTRPLSVSDLLQNFNRYPLMSVPEQETFFKNFGLVNMRLTGSIQAALSSASLEDFEGKDACYCRTSLLSDADGRMYLIPDPSISNYTDIQLKELSPVFDIPGRVPSQGLQIRLRAAARVQKSGSSYRVTEKGRIEFQ